MSKIIKDINFFTDKDKEKYKDIEEYLNPIYGVVMRETGYIENNYYLANQRSAVKQPLTSEMSFILKISTVVPPDVKPTKDIIQYINPYTIGRYIAILYFYKKTANKFVYDLLLKSLYDQQNPRKSIEYSRAFALLTAHNPNEKEKEETSKEIFHILLYCLWWVSNNMEGIQNYYRGINDTFNQINTREITPINYSRNEISRVISDLSPPDRKTQLGKLLKVEKDKEKIAIIRSEIDKLRSSQRVVREAAAEPSKLDNNIGEIEALIKLLNDPKAEKDTLRESEGYVQNMAIIKKLNEKFKTDITTRLKDLVVAFPIVSNKK
jgi:hypothetical protein